MARRRRPDRDRLYEISSAQEGHFSTAQAREAGYSPQLLMKHLAGGRIRRVRRGVYRLVHFPEGEHEDLVALWLWSGRSGVFSHRTALALHDLSEALPACVEMTLPAGWSLRRLRVPAGLILHFSDLEARDAAWVGPVRVTSVARTLEDCARSRVEPRIVRNALDDALARGLMGRKSVPETTSYLGAFFRTSAARTDRPGRRRP